MIFDTIILYLKEIVFEGVEYLAMCELPVGLNKSTILVLQIACPRSTKGQLTSALILFVLTLEELIYPDQLQ